MILGSRDGTDYRYIADRLKKKTGVDFDKKSMAENRDALMAGVESNIEKEIIETAILMDGNLDHTGLHAAGVIISDNDDLAEYIPVAWDSGFETWKTQCDMVQCESKHGLLKMDLLLLKTLDIVTYALRLIKENHPNDVIDIENLPFEEDVFKHIYAAGDTKAVFQFESGGMIKFLRQMQPTCIEDIIAANAMYRPGPMDSIPDYVKAKHSGNIVYDCPELEPILKETYGIIVYQEQVMRIFRDLAGYSMGRSDLVRRAMAKKHMDELVAERKNFIYGNEQENIHGCVPAGISEEAANKMFDKMLSFAAYAFNKSHAAVYSVTSYMTAWIKYHYPAEFYCAALNFTGAQKEIPSIIADAKKHGIQVLSPDVNKSQSKFSTENGNIRFGLEFLAGAKSRASAVVEARESGYKSFREFVQSKPGKTMAEACILSGACDRYIENNPDKRAALLASYVELSDLYDNILNAEARLANAEKDDVRQKAEIAHKDLCVKWELAVLPDVKPMTLMERLNEEQKYTSVYFSGDPLDSFDIDPEAYKEIGSLEDGESVWIAAALSDEKILKTKRDALSMLSGRLTDRTGSVNCIAFPRVYDKIAANLQTVMAFQGRMSANGDEEPQFVIANVKALPQKTKRIIVWFDDYNATRDVVRRGSVPKSEGMEAWMVGKNSKMYRTGVSITEEYAIANGLRYKIDT
jgi:DNA polymerase-3 subunit alpha